MSLIALQLVVLALSGALVAGCSGGEDAGPADAAADAPAWDVGVDGRGGSDGAAQPDGGLDGSSGLDAAMDAARADAAGDAGTGDASVPDAASDAAHMDGASGDAGTDGGQDAGPPCDLGAAGARGFLPDCDEDGYGDGDAVVEIRCADEVDPSPSELPCADATSGAWVLLGEPTDCCDDDADAYPGATGWHSSATACGGFDYNCDGSDTQQFPFLLDCSAACSRGGWIDIAVPECGDIGTWNTCSCSGCIGCGCCSPGLFGMPRSQSCH